jgi:hypothetical protein
MRTSANAHSGTPGSHRCRILPPATASKPTTMTQKYQYSQPTAKPAQPPRALRAEHAHDQDDEHAGYRVGEECCWTDRVHHHA